MCVLLYYPANIIKLYFLFVQTCTSESWESVCHFWTWKGRACRSLLAHCFMWFAQRLHIMQPINSSTCVVDCRLRSKHSETYTPHTIHYLKMTHNICGLFPFSEKEKHLQRLYTWHYLGHIKKQEVFHGFEPFNTTFR